MKNSQLKHTEHCSNIPAVNLDHRKVDGYGTEVHPNCQVSKTSVASETKRERWVRKTPQRISSLWYLLCGNGPGGTARK